MQRLLLGVDRLDYTKGIKERLLFLERFLQSHPEWARRVVLVQVVVPSRHQVDEYRAMKREIDREVGRINHADHVCQAGGIGEQLGQPVRRPGQDVRIDHVPLLVGEHREVEHVEFHEVVEEVSSKGEIRDQALAHHGDLADHGCRVDLREGDRNSEFRH